MAVYRNPVRIRNSLSLLYEGRTQQYATESDFREGAVSRRNLSQDIEHVVEERKLISEGGVSFFRVQNQSWWKRSEKGKGRENEKLIVEYDEQEEMF